MEQRDLGHSGLKVSVLGYGSWGIGNTGWRGADDEESLRALRQAIDGGVNFIDTAAVYGGGHSEELVGQAVRDTRGQVQVATKVPPKNWQWPAGPGVHAGDAYPADWVVECTKVSLSHLGLESVDLQQFHVWSDEWVDQGDWQDAVEELKKEGLIKAFGVSVNDHQPANAVRLVESGLAESVQVIYNIFDQSPEDELLPAAQKAGVGVIVRVPFDEGSLAGKVTPDTEFPEDDFRANYFAGHRKQEVYEKAQAIAQDLGIAFEQLPEVALRFCLSHPAASTVIAGMRSTASVAANLAAAEKGPLPSEQLEVLRRHRWARNFYG